MLVTYLFGRCSSVLPGCIIFLLSALLCGTLGGVAAAQDPVDTDPVQPPVVITPEQNQPMVIRRSGGDPADMTYPDLRQQEFEGLNSALRGGNLFDSPQSATIITRSDLKERQPRTMIEAMERTPGVLMQRTGAGQISPYVRGLTGRQTVLLVDGIRMTNSTFRAGPNQYFALIDPGMVDSIQVVRGPQSTLWGSDALGGVINVVSRSVKPTHSYRTNVGGDITSYYGSADRSSYSRGNVEISTTNTGFFSGGSYLNANDLYIADGIQPMTDYAQFAGDGRMDIQLTRKSSLTLAAQHFQQQNVPRSDKWLVEDAKKEVRRFNPQMRDLGYVRYNASYEMLLFDELSLTGSYQRMEEDQHKHKLATPTTRDRVYFDVNTLGLTLALGRDLRQFGKLRYGIEWYNDDVNAFSTRLDTTSGTITPRDAAYADGSWYESFGAYMNWDTALISDWLLANAGVRYSNIEAGYGGGIGKYDQWTTSAGLTFKLTKDVNLITNYSQGFRAPNLNDLSGIKSAYSILNPGGSTSDNITLPNTDLDAETAETFEIGFKTNFRRFRTSTFYFWTTLEDLIERQPITRAEAEAIMPGISAQYPDPDTQFSQPQNVARNEMNGLEFEAEYMLSSIWSLYGNATYTIGWNVTGGEWMSRVPPLQGVVGVRARATQMRAWLDFYAWIVADQDLLSARDAGDVRIGPDGTPGYTTLNLSTGYSLGRYGQLSAVLYNLTNQKYQVHGSGVFGPGFGAQIGYSLGF